MDPLAAALDAYEPRDVDEADDRGRMRALLAHDDPWSRSEPLHVTASALIVHPPTRRVLLRWHERMQQWMQVGGHGDPGEQDPWAVASREAREETGLDDLQPLTSDGSRRPLQIVIVPVPPHGDDPAHEHADIRYAFRTARPERAVAETSGAQVRWLPIDDAIHSVHEHNLRVFLARVRDLLTVARDATREDATELARLLAQLGYPTPVERVVAALPAATGPDGGVIVVEGRHGSLAGFASYRSVYFFEDGAPRCRITALTVDEGARRSGVAGVLLEEVERRARSHGCTEIEVASARRPERDAAHHLYPAAGFEDATSTVGFYSRRLHF